MKGLALALSLLAVALAGSVAAQQNAGAAAKGLPKVFDPARDPATDLRVALAEAKRTGRRVLVDVGGEWCGWCHLMDKFLEEHTDLKGLRDKGFVWLKVNFSQENKNEKFLSAYPAIKGYPHLFVLDSEGKLLHSQDTGELEEGKGYNLAKYTAFLKAWSPKKN
ncbi:MAG: thioredoxin family protein [Fimbriimonadaceae bacterium]|nr:thioredoxin family protein [Fimbriimonadaceae bacterium]